MRFGGDAARTKHSAMKHIGMHTHRRLAMLDHLSACYLGSLKQFIGDKAIMFSFKPLFTPSRSAFALAERSTILCIRMRHATRIDPVLEHIPNHLLADG